MKQSFRMGEFFLVELTKKYIHQDCQKGRAFSQITLDDDFNVPDSKPDVIRLIQERGEIKLEETTLTAGHIWLKGVLRFQILYRSDSEEHKVDSFSGEIPFQESLAIDSIDEYDTARVRWQVEDLSVSMINSRKLSVRALVQLLAAVDELQEVEAAVGAQAEEGMETLVKTHTILQLTEARKDTWRYKEEIMLPSNKPNIRQVLWKSVQLRGVETRLSENQIAIKGEAMVFVLYLGEEEEGRLEWLETSLPFTGAVECGGANEDQLLDLSHAVAAVELEPKPDYDGEERMLHLELVLDLDIRIYQEEQIQLLEDVYSIHSQLLPEFVPTAFERLLMKNASKCKVSQRVAVGENQEGILQLCTGEGAVAIDQVEVTQDGLVVEGTLAVQILYITADDRMPLSSLRETIPFHHMVEAPGMTPQCRYQLECSLEQMTTVMLEGTQVEVKAVIGLSAIVFEQNPAQRLVNVGEEPLNLEQLQESPGIIGYIGRAGDRLWDIAKENYTTISDIKETNHLADDILKGGEKILIIKKVG